MDLMTRNGINQEITEEIIKIKLKNTGIQYVFKKEMKGTASYRVCEETIYLSVNSIINLVKNYLEKNSLQDHYPNCNYNEVLIYFYIFALNHEVNHAFQHLTGKNVLKTNI